MNHAADARTALVTGGSSGIGLAIARMLVEERFDVTIASRNPEKLKTAARRLGGAHAVQGDVSLDRDCEQIIHALHERCGRLDVLVNSAGILYAGPVADLPVTDWDRLFAVNVRGTFLMTKLALPLLQETQGLIVNLASIAGKGASPGLAAYGATKAAVISLTNSVNAEIEKHRVRAIAICPGFVDTPMASISTSPREDMIQPVDCAEVVRMALRLSPQARIPEVTIERAWP